MLLTQLQTDGRFVEVKDEPDIWFTMTDTRSPGQRRWLKTSSCFSFLSVSRLPTVRSPSADSGEGTIMLVLGFMDISLYTTVLMTVSLVLYIYIVFKICIVNTNKFQENYLQFRTSYLILLPTICNVSATIPKMTSLSRPAASVCSGCLKTSSLTMKRTTRQSPYRDGCWPTTAPSLTLLIHSHQR